MCERRFEQVQKCKKDQMKSNETETDHSFISSASIATVMTVCNAGEYYPLRAWVYLISLYTHASFITGRAAGDGT